MQHARMKILVPVFPVALAFLLGLVTTAEYGCRSGAPEEGGAEGKGDQPGKKTADEIAQDLTEQVEEKVTRRKVGRTVEIEKEVAMNEEIPVLFRFRDYTNANRDARSMAELEAGLKLIEGRATFRFLEFGSMDRISETLDDNIGRGKTIYYAVFEFKGDNRNPRGNSKIHPFATDESGTDPAPQPVLVIDGKAATSSAYYLGRVAKKLGVEKRYAFDGTAWVKTVATWEKDKGLDPELALFYLGMDGQKHYLKIKK